MQNPFVYGEVVPAAAFVNRVAELDRLVGDLAAGQKIFLISPRRYGKSSLIRQALAAMARRGALTVEVTVSSFSSYVAFLEGYARALVAAETRWDRARTWLREAIRSARAEVRYAPDASPLGAAHASRSPASAPTATSRGSRRKCSRCRRSSPRRASRKVVVALDEFQAIGGFNGGSVEHALRAAVQHQREVGYVFAGSEPSLMERMLDAEAAVLQGRAGDAAREDSGRRVRRVHRRAVHAIGHPARAGPRRGDRRAGRQPALRRAAAGARNLGRGTRAASRRRATLDDLHQALRRLLAEQQMMFEAVWQRLTLAQRAVLRAVVLEEGGLLSADVRTRHRLGGPPPSRRRSPRSSAKT